MIDGLIKFARAGELPGDRLAMLGEMAITAKAEGWSSDQFRAEAEKREPGSAGLLACMPSNKVEWFTFIGLLIMALQLMQASSGYTLKDLLQPAPEPVPGPVAAVTRQVTDSTPKVAPSRIAPKPKAAGRHKIGRNDPCHCGSGIKYKRCHGALN